MAEPPYGEIADSMKKGEIVPLLGAGVNFGARPPGAAWDEATAAFFPSGAELSRYLASKVNFPSQDPHDLSDLAKVSSYYAEMLGRRRLRERLNALFCREFNLCDIHTYLAEVAAHAPLSVVTDQAIQRTPTATGRPPDAPAITVQAATAAAQISNFRVTSVRADVAPDVITSCPTTLRLQGAIEVSQPGTLYYRWERSDGVLLSPVDLTFTAAGTKTVTDTWAINYLASGWARLKIVSPESPLSNQASFAFKTVIPSSLQNVLEENLKVSTNLGCPQESPSKTIDGAIQSFQNGLMLWRGDKNRFIC